MIAAWRAGRAGRSSPQAATNARFLLSGEEAGRTWGSVTRSTSGEKMGWGHRRELLHNDWGAE